MQVYRMAVRTHSADLSGTGAALYPGRWNKKGSPILYTSQSVELALLETIVNTPPMIVPEVDILTLEIPEDSIEVLEVADLPPNWRHYPAPTVLAHLGQQWIDRGKALALRVPSCIVPTSFNYLVNCRHRDHALLKVIGHRPFGFDLRLKKGG